MSEPEQRPVKIALHLKSRTLELEYPAGDNHRLSAEYLRINSPSAEVRGHGSPILQIGKRDVALVGIEPSGHYALKLVFDDGHDTGLFTWEYLYKLCQNEAENWQRYLQQLEEAGASREPVPKGLAEEVKGGKSGGCGSR
ncbi:MAG: DUF971 family protein [Motiliproteus sp.]|jgi:DUF971 family protein